MSNQVVKRKEIVEAFCYLREAERSIHRALNPACRWSDFVAYYDAEKRAGLRHFAERFQPALRVAELGFPSQEDARRVAQPRWWSILFGACFGRWEKSWRFSADEIAYIGAVFGAIIQLLTVTIKPSAEELVEARMATCGAVCIIRDRCYGLAELQRAFDVVHFDQSPNLPLLPIADILRDVA